jgi:secreted Zn-dependent insulinase-like peptidase
MIQSPTVSCSNIAQSLDKNLVNIGNQVMAMSDVEFDRIKSYVFKKISEPVDCQAKDFEVNWRELAQHRYDFERREKELKDLGKIRKAEF